MSGIATYSELDSRRFGVRIYRARVSDLAQAEELVAFVEGSDAELVFARVPVEASGAVQALERAAFFLTDTLIYYKGPVRRLERPSVDDVTITTFDAGHRSQLEALARASFSDYRGHYHSDPRLDPAAATEGYVDWGLRTTTDPNGFVLVSLTEAKLSGFISVKLVSKDLGDIILNGVSPEFRRRGIYSALVEAAGERLRRLGRREVLASTQLSNLAPQKVWIRYGLEPHETFYTLHRWSSA